MNFCHIENNNTNTLAMEDITKNPSGTSLLVPSVQELSKQNLRTVPQRYIQPHHDQHMLLISQEAHSLEIPVIDMHNLLSAESKSLELEKLHLACKDWGFFQVFFIIICLSVNVIHKTITLYLICVGF